MKFSKLVSKTRKEAPKDETSKNAQLLIRAGFIHKEMAGVYSLLPLGVRVFDKIQKIIKEEMDSIDGAEISMTALQNPEIWKASDRWDDEKVDNWFKTKLKNETELGLGFTHEEPISNMLVDHVNSYKDLPLYVYQFQTKFRNELRSKSGILRGREFLMKDLYSFCKTQQEQDEYYEKAKQAYINIFDRTGLGEKTHYTFASGGAFSEFSHEFQTETESGEDTIYVDQENKVAINKEIYTDENIEKADLDKKKLKEVKSIEVGNIFNLGQKYAEAVGLKFKNEEGKEQFPFMGSYGIGIGRLMGTVVEVLSDEKGIVWPKEIAPFDVHLVVLQNDESVLEEANKIYEGLKANGTEVLFDDREMSAGEKFNDVELIGIPISIVVSKRSIEEGNFEVKDRKTGEMTQKPFFDIVDGDFTF
jgi:prolyl-tRNA synthetase